MPKYEDYPFYDLLLDKVSEPGNKVISAVKDKIGSVVDYDTASDLVTFNPNEYSFEVFRSAIIADNLMNIIDGFKDNVDSINAYIKDWQEYITKIKVSEQGCSTFVVLDNEAFVDDSGYLDYGSKIFNYDNLVFENEDLPDKVMYDRDTMKMQIVIRLGETKNTFKRNDYPFFSKLLAESKADFCAFKNDDNEEVVMFDGGDIDIIINANRPEEEIE